MKKFYGEMWGSVVEASEGRDLWKPCETPHMVLWKLLNTCGWIFGLVHARLGCWIIRNTLPWHITAQLVSAQQNEILLRLAGMNYVKIRTHARLKIWWHNIVKQGIMYLKQSWKWMLARLLTVDFLTMLTISLSLFFNRIAKHGIICVIFLT